MFMPRRNLGIWVVVDWFLSALNSVSESRLKVSELGTLSNSSWRVALLMLSTIILLLDGWAVFEPYAGDVI